LFVNISREELHGSAGLGRPKVVSKEGKLGILTQLQVQRYSNKPGLRDIMIVEKGVVLVPLLKLLSDRGRPVIGHSQ
jgi:hypothetical protein